MAGDEVASDGFDFKAPPGARQVDVKDLKTIKDLSDLPGNFLIGAKR